MPTLSRTELRDLIWDRAQQHGEDSEPDHEVGDLQAAVEILLSLVPRSKLDTIPRLFGTAGLDGWEENP
jgi:hypothetical protein